MSTKRISEILWDAANLWLSDGSESLEFSEFHAYTCYAVIAAEDESYPDKSNACVFLKRLGCDCGSGRQFDEFSFGEQRQGARYAWLMFASMYAEELEARGEL